MEKPKYINGLKTFVECKICGNKYSQLINHIKKHDMTKEEYLNKFGGDLISEYEHHIRSESSKIREKRPDIKEKRKEHFKKLWEDGVYDDPKIREKFNSFEGKKHSNEYKEYMRNLMTGRDVTWNDKISESHWSKSKHKNDVVKKRINTITENNSWNDIGKKISESWIIRNNDIDNHSVWKSCKRGYYLSTKTNRKEYYHSSYELGRMIELDEDDSVIYWTKRHKIHISYYTKDGRTHTYFPDFLIEYVNRKVLEEVKGWVQDEEIFELKNQAAIKYTSERNMEYFVNFWKK